MGTPCYTEEFRLSAVQLVTDKGLSAQQVAKDLGITDATVRSWVKKHSKRKIRQLKRDLSESKETVEILKKQLLF